MNIESVKNYGRPYSETMTTLPRAVQKRIRREGATVIRKHLGLLGLLRLLFLTWREKRRMLRMDLDPVRRKGLANGRFINFIIQNTAMFSATAKMVGMDRALTIHREIMDQVAVPMNEALLPSRLEFERLSDLFGAFRQYMLAFLEAERKAGLHEYRIVEDSDDAIAIDVTYCAFCEIPKHLGIMEACESGCYSDEVFFPGFLEPLGLRFARTKTLARKGDRCDFRFERISAHGSREGAPRGG
jgi:hypothetical protein